MYWSSYTKRASLNADSTFRFERRSYLLGRDVDSEAPFISEKIRSRGIASDSYSPRFLALHPHAVIWIGKGPAPITDLSPLWRGGIQPNSGLICITLLRTMIKHHHFSTDQWSSAHLPVLFSDGYWSLLYLQAYNWNNATKRELWTRIDTCGRKVRERWLRKIVAEGVVKRKTNMCGFSHIDLSNLFWYSTSDILFM